MPRFAIATLAAALLLAAPARAVTLVPDSLIGRLVQIVVTMHACEIQPTDAQQTAITNAGQAMQDKLHASDADLDALVAKFGDGKPAGGCDPYKANFDRTLNAALAAAR